MHRVDLSSSLVLALQRAGMGPSTTVCSDCGSRRASDNALGERAAHMNHHDTICALRACSRSMGESDLTLPGRRRVGLANLPVDLLTQQELELAIKRKVEDSSDSQSLLLGSANLDHVYKFAAQTADVDFDASRWIVTLDGAPLARAARRKTGCRWPLIAGSRFLPRILEMSQQRGWSVGFLGGTRDQHERLSKIIPSRWPNLRVSGYWAPVRHDLLDSTRAEAIADSIRAERTQILVVGLGKPLQEIWLETYAGRAGISVGCAFGGSADFLAGVQRSAPSILVRLQAEWLWRLAWSPKRLAKRYLIEGPRALWLLKMM